MELKYGRTDEVVVVRVDEEIPDSEFFDIYDYYYTKEGKFIGKIKI